jgi:hypothetical protein
MFPRLADLVRLATFFAFARFFVALHSVYLTTSTVSFTLRRLVDFPGVESEEQILEV